MQVSSDEVAIIEYADRYASLPGVDPFGLSDYLARPALLFLGWGDLGRAARRHRPRDMRRSHGLFGLLLIGASYLLFRQLLGRGWAVVRHACSASATPSS